MPVKCVTIFVTFRQNFDNFQKILKNPKAIVDLTYILDHILRNLSNPMKNKGILALSKLFTSRGHKTTVSGKG